MYKLTPEVKHFLRTAKPQSRAIATIEAIKSSRSDKPDPKILAKLSGWGSIQKLIWDENKYPKLRRELEELLTPEQMEHARKGTFWAFHTEPTYIKMMWDVISKAGFTGGRILDPCCGSGHYFGMMLDFDLPCELWATEIDPIAANVAKCLYPEAKVINIGFEDFKIPDGYFDLAISNVPFGDTKICDRDCTYQSNLSIHNYFVEKMLRKVRAGGLIAVITSSFFRDNKDSSFRNWLSQRAELVGSTRLHREAFKAFAGTEVCTDVLFFRKFHDGETRDEIPAWVETEEIEVNGTIVRTNCLVAEDIRNGNCI